MVEPVAVETVIAPPVVFVEAEPEVDDQPSLFETFGPWQGVKISDLTSRSCRYIEGDPVDATYCGLTKTPGSSYCDAHAELCGGKTLPKRVSDAVYKQRAKALSAIIARG